MIDLVAKLIKHFKAFLFQQRIQDMTSGKEAFSDYRLKASNFSKIEMSILRFVINNDYNGAADYLISNSLVSGGKDKEIVFTREMNEIILKLEKLGISIDWEDTLNKFLLP